MPPARRRAHGGPGGAGCSEGERVPLHRGGHSVQGIISAAISAYFARQSSQERTREAVELRRLTLMLMQILDGAGVIQVKEWDLETGEPRRWSVGTSREISHRVEAPTPRWKRAWRKVFGERS